jgi:hypothetical protein
MTTSDTKPLGRYEEERTGLLSNKVHHDKYLSHSELRDAK